ncbi:zinc-dependent alcohol dehydrogenase family protein [Streptomyces sp. NPDC057950]|uniref:zinc-dependent alcohol dehydrogenase family protein n=1 Tax=Streptomyces sp. NPDC057950 TaxID=3346288 RepID=UPI0036EE6F77
MRAIRLIEFGQAEQVIQVADIPEPTPPAAGEVLIQVEYAPLDHHDLLLARGTYPVRPALPSVIGHEGAGSVLAVGPGVNHLKNGDTVVIPFGTYSWAEQVVIKAAGLTALDPAIDLRQAAMLRINPTTAGLLLEQRYLPEDTWVVQNAANSGVGRSVIAFAKERGFRTINIVRREELIDELKNLGGDIVALDSPELGRAVRAQIGDVPVSLGLDGVSGTATGRLIDVLTQNALLVSYAHMSGEPFAPDADALQAKNVETSGFWMYQEKNLDRHPALAVEAERLVATGKLKMPVTAVYEAGEFSRALAHLRREGKVLLDFNAHRSQL